MAMRVQTEGTNHTKSRKENRDNRMTELLMNFCRCGIAGWCLEVMFTSVDSIMAGDWTLMGQTSLLMFPIYGMGALLFPISRFIDSWLTGLPGLEDAGQDRLSRAGRAIRHGLVYMVLIFIAEYITGIWLTSMVHIDGRKDFSPVIQRALELGGFREEVTLPGINGGTMVTTGFGREAVLAAAGTVAEAVRTKELRHIFLVGGCDGEGLLPGMCL